jgi:hypothetical protein
MSGVCDTAATKKCLAPTCSDAVRNGNEADVDCGGTCPKKCPGGKLCVAGSDCASGACQTAAAPPVCAHDFCSEGVTAGLVLCLDASNPNSYIGTGTVWTNLAGTGNDGTLTNGPTYSSADGGSIGFDGSNDFVTSGGLAGDFTDFTVSISFYPKAVANYQNAIDCNYAFNGTTGNIGPRLEWNAAGALAWVVSGNTTNNGVFDYFTVLGSGLAASTWHFVSITRSAAKTSTYYKATAALSNVASPAGFVNVMNNVNVGRGFNLGGAERYMNGNVATVQIYRRGLSAAEIQQNFDLVKVKLGM